MFPVATSKRLCGRGHVDQIDFHAPSSLETNVSDASVTRTSVFGDFQKRVTDDITMTAKYLREMTRQYSWSE